MDDGARGLNDANHQRILWVVIRMYYDEHSPAHFHAYYGEHSAQIAIDSLEIIGGALPKRALTLTVEWAIAHREELRSDWRRAQEHQPLFPIAPLE